MTKVRKILRLDEVFKDYPYPDSLNRQYRLKINIAKFLNIAIDKSRKADEIVRSALNTLPQIDAIATQGGAFADQLATFLQNNDAAFQALTPVVKQNLILLQQTADAVTQLTGMLQDANLDPQKALASIAVLSDVLTTGVAVIDRTIDLFIRLNTYLPGNPLSDSISRLSGLKVNFGNQIQVQDLWLMKDST